MLKKELLKVESMVVDNNPEWQSELDRITSNYTSTEDIAIINGFIKDVMSRAKRTLDKVEKCV
ncbi:MAG: hypothetical protein MJ010_01875 [Paludibacteraceae bacterium]|nr:hypothetical protein [Paludibacteraceae bacterium]